MESQTGADDNPFELSHVPASSSASSFSLSESGTSSTLAAYSAPDTQPDATSQEYTQQRQDGGGTSDSSPLCSKFLSSFTSSNLFLFALCHVFTCTGLVVSILGPVLNLLAYQTSSSFENIVWIFTMRSIGFFLGGLIGPAVLEKDWAKQHPRLTLLVPVSLEFLSTILIPSVSSLWILFILLLVQGTSIGSAENMCKLLLVRLFKEKAAPYMNLLFGCFGVGGIVAPLIVSAFLPSTSAAATSTAITDASQYSTSYRGAFFVVAAILAPNILILSATALQEEISWAQIKNALLGRASAPSAGSVASSIESSMMADEASQTSPQNPQQQADNTVVADSKGGGSVLQALRALPPIQIFMALNVTGVIFMYLGVELWGSFLATLGQNCYGMNPADASLLSSAFWLSFTTGRMLGVPLSSKFKPMQLLTTDMCGMVFSLLLMLIAPSSIGMLWFGSMVYGMSIASIYASSLNWYAAYYPLTGPVIALTTVGDSAGAAVLPLIVGATLASSPTTSTTIASSDNTIPTGTSSSSSLSSSSSSSSTGMNLLSVSLASPIACLLTFLIFTLIMIALLATLHYYLLPRYNVYNAEQQSQKNARAAVLEMAADAAAEEVAADAGNPQVQQLP